MFKRITDICLNVTESCNMRCRYCFVEQHPNRMSYQVAKDTADWIMENAKQEEEEGSIGFFGGEPLLEWDSIIVPLVKYIRDDCGSRMNLSVTSNCTLMTRDKLEFMRKYDIGLLVSMDGGKDTQDYNRPLANGASSFDILKEKIPMILEYHPETTFRCTITPATCGNFCQDLEFAKNMGFTHAFAIINEFEEWSDEKRRILEAEARKYSNYLISCCRQGKGFIRQRTLEQAINKIVAVNTGIRARMLDRIEVKESGRVCGTGIGYGSVNYNGDIYSCQEVASRKGEKDIFYLGNIYTGIDIHRVQKLHDATQNIKIINNQDRKKCKACPIEFICDINTCIVNNYIDNNDFSLQSDNICWWHNLMAKEAQYICKVLGEENNKFFKDYFTWVITSYGGCLSE